MNQLELRYRQVHLDFHTSPLIPDIGEKFNGAEFAQTLKDAHVDSVTCFARCHHGMLYYDSKKFPERIHPNLTNKNMLKEMIQECHKRDIRVPIYITIQWDYFTAKEHPEWLATDADGRPLGTGPYEAGFYQVLCVNTPYRDMLKEQITELFEEMEVDGIFMDIVYPTECSCKYCTEKMKAAGVDVYDSEARMQYAQDMIDEFKFDISRHIRIYSPDASIFYNTSHIGVKQRKVKEAYTHFELESLPSGDWGYIHFPVTMRYARTLGLDCLSHTGKFHLEWGDFHSFKNLPALEYECFRMLALGSKCLIGDQMEPCGKLSEPVYDLIGNVYERVEKLEPWCKNAVPVSDIGVLSPEEFMGGNRGRLPESLMGLENMFDQLGYQFDILDSQGDFSRYPLLILPDDIVVNEVLHKKLKEYLDQGGKMIATYESGLDESKTAMVLKETGVTLLPNPDRTLDGELTRGKITKSNDYVDYIIPNEKIGIGLPMTEHVMYAKGTEVLAVEEAEELLKFTKPYFDRNFKHFCSHRQTPSSGQTGTDAVVQLGQVIYFASPVFQIYNARAPKWCKVIVKDAVNRLLPEKCLKYTGPSTLFAALNEQKEAHRKVLHLLHYIPQKISQDIHTLEDVIPIYHIPVEILENRKVTAVRNVPEGKELEFIQKNNRVSFHVEEVNGYRVIEIVYEE